MTAAAAEPVGTLATALAHAEQLLAEDPALAEAQAREILLVEPRSAQAQFLLGLAASGQGQASAAIAALEQATALDPGHAQAWRALGDLHTLAEDRTRADAAYARHIRASVSDPELLAAATALCDNDLPVAERLLKAFLKIHPTDVAAIRMLAETAVRLGRYDAAEALLERCLELAPSFTAARHNYATVLHRQNKPVEAIAEVDRLLAAEPAHPGYRNLKAATLGRVGEFDQAIDLYAGVLKDHPGQAKVWMSYGHALKTVGRQADAIAAYRRCLELTPSMGEAWWSLANLKTVQFSDADVAAMRAGLARGGLAEEDRFHLDFALGKALEDAGDYGASFGHYAAGNALRRQTLAYDPDATSAHVAASKALLTAPFFAARTGEGDPAPDPIFVVGLPRSGSTLVEQILASHARVEGTQELPDIIALTRRLGGRTRGAYLQALAGLTAGERAALGAEYLERAGVHRKLGRPLFIDKMPNNFAHLGLIRLILPNAKVIDARRHPLGCGFSGFKQHFARGQGFTYSLTDIGRYYADYVALMAHFDAVLPGWVHRVYYERMVADPEAEVRALLDHCGLAFEPACLTFYENDRAVRTASSEQVRTPIFTDAADHWRNYEPWLDPLKASLGDALSAYLQPSLVTGTT